MGGHLSEKLRESGEGVKGGFWRVINSGAILYLDLFTQLQGWILLQPAKHQRLNCPMLDKKMSKYF